MNKIDLKRRCTIITGGAQGIGFAIAERLLSSGAAVSLDSNEVLLRTAGDKLSTTRKVHICPVDVTDDEFDRNPELALSQNFCGFILYG